MTIHELDTPFQLPHPDPVVVKTSREDMVHQINALSDIYLPVLGEKLQDLHSELGAVDASALNVLTVVAPVLANDGLPELLDSIIALRAKEGSDEVAAAVAELSNDLQGQISESLAKVGNYVQAFDDGLTNFRAVSLSEVRFLIAPLQEETTELDADLTAQKASVEALLKQENAVNTLIADVESISLLDRFLPLVKSLEKLTEVDPKNPLIGAINAGLEGIKNILNLSNDAIKYEHLINIRASVQGQLDVLRSSIRALQERQSGAGKKLGQLQAVVALDVPKGLYLQEAGKLLEALRRFLTSSGAATDEDIVVYASRFISHSRVVGNYLNELRREWRT